MKTIDMTPTWESAVKIYIAVLENENASFEGKRNAREDLVSLAKTMDQLSKNKDEELTEKELKAVFDVVNVFEPEDISHVYPAMATDEFMKDIMSAWKKMLKNLDNTNQN